MLIREYSTGLRHFVGKTAPFGIDTICGKELITDDFVTIDGGYTECTCEACFDEINRDLNRKPIKKEKIFPI
jgi:hypothetical protein